MPTLDATVGGASANSYASVADADTYFTERLQATGWTGEDTDDKERALIMATRRIDQEQFQGAKNSSGQALKWPRVAATDDDGEEYGTSTIATPVLHATYELALRLLNDDDDSVDTFADTGLEEFTMARAGPLDVERNRNFRAGQLPANVRRLLRPVLETSGATVILRRA